MEDLMAGRGITSNAALCVLCGVLLMGQAPAQPRRIDFNRTPIVEKLRSSERHVVIFHPTATPAFHSPAPGTSPLTSIAEYNPVILVGRIVQKRPEFLSLRGLQEFTAVPMAEANWIGSSLTVLIERVIATTLALPLMEGDRLAFIVDGDGSTIINGTRVDAETPWLWPIEPGKRYLLVGRFEDGSFAPSGMFLEPYDGAAVRGPVRRPARPDRGILFPYSDPQFEFDFDMFNFTQRLEQEVAKLKGRAPR